MSFGNRRRAGSVLSRRPPAALRCHLSARKTLPRRIEYVTPQIQGFGSFRNAILPSTNSHFPFSQPGRRVSLGDFQFERFPYREEGSSCASEEREDDASLLDPMPGEYHISVTHCLCPQSVAAHPLSPISWEEYDAATQVREQDGSRLKAFILF